MKNIGFFTPVTNYPSRFNSFTESYFNFGTKSAEIVHSAPEAHYVKLNTSTWTAKAIVITALKVALVFTLLLPLTALLFAAKVVFRLNHHFTLDTDNAPHKLQGHIETAQNSIGRLNHEIEQHQTRIAQLHQEIEGKNRELSAFSEENIRLQQQLNDARALHELLLLSSSAAATAASGSENDPESVPESAPGNDPGNDPVSPLPELLELEEDFVTIDKASDPFETDLQNYIDKYCPGFSLAGVLDKIKAGELFFKGIFEDHNKLLLECHNLSEEKQKEQIGSLVWYFMARALKKNQAFNEGTFTTPYRPQELYRFLLSYPGVYSRQQSHLKERVPLKGYGFGIDFTGGPAQKTHLLFELIDDGKLLFIKPENYGVKTLKDTAFHAVEFLESLGRHAGLGSNQAEGMRKERVNPQWIKLFQNFICSEKERVLRDANIWGLSYMRNYLSAYQKALENFLAHCDTDPSLFDDLYKLVPESLEKSQALLDKVYLQQKLEQVREALNLLPELKYEAQTGDEVFLGGESIDLGLHPDLMNEVTK